MPELKPCPFCGGEAEYQQFVNPQNYYAVKCTTCDCGTDGYRLCNFDATPKENKSRNVAVWNTRPDNWISVKDRTPKNGDYVLCVSGAGIVQIALYDTSVYVYGFYANSVTHWQPLPTPPKGCE